MVTGAECTNAEYDIVHVGTAAEATASGQPWVGAPVRHVFTNCDMGRGSGSVIRAFMSGSARNTFINHESYGAPIYGEYGGNSYIDCGAPVWRINIQASAQEFPPGHSVWIPWLNKTLWSDGTDWRDAAGTIVNPNS